MQAHELIVRHFTSEVTDFGRMRHANWTRWSSRMLNAADFARGFIEPSLVLVAVNSRKLLWLHCLFLVQAGKPFLQLVSIDQFNSSWH
jgi:hypothetical protein